MRVGGGDEDIEAVPGSWGGRGELTEVEGWEVVLKAKDVYDVLEGSGGIY